MKIIKALFLVHCFGILLFSIGINNSIVAQAEPARLVETKGNIGFSGIYEPEMEPQPKPPDGTEEIYPNEEKAKPKIDRFPQLGQISKRDLFWLSVLLVFVVFAWAKYNKGKNRHFISKISN